MNLDDVKAGRYELVALRWDEVLSKPGEPFDFKRHRRGDTVDLDVEQARRLVKAGAVRPVGADDQADPDDQADADEPSGPPAKSAAKGEWVAYATDEARGDDRLTEEQANDLTKDQLIKKYSS